MKSYDTDFGADNFCLCCPVCREPLLTEDKCYRCTNGHSYDIARGGYVNLLMSNKSADKRHGDDTLMIGARTAFLDGGYYRPLLDKICEMLLPHANNDMCILDAGCGEGWYLAGLLDRLSGDGIQAEAVGVDISKAALKAASRRLCRDGEYVVSLAVAGVNALPVKSRSCDIVLSIFAPVCEKEFSRVLRRGGRLVRVVPLERHLFGLKQAVYDNPYENPPAEDELEGFALVDSCDLRYNIELEGSEVISQLFAMTPYYYKTSAQDQAKLAQLASLTTEIEFGVRIYENVSNNR